MLFTGIIKKNEEGMYTYTCICSRIKLINEKQKKKKTKPVRNFAQRDFDV